MKGTQVTVNGKSVKAGPGTPKEFTNGSGLTFNPEFLKKHGYDKLSDISVLLPQKNREKWEKIGIPSGDIGDGDAIKDDGKKPSAPKSAKKSNDKLTWDKDRKSTRLNSSHVATSYAVFCLKKKRNIRTPPSENTDRRRNEH